MGTTIMGTRTIRDVLPRLPRAIDGFRVGDIERKCEGLEKFRQMKQLAAGLAMRWWGFDIRSISQWETVLENQRQVETP